MEKKTGDTTTLPSLVKGRLVKAKVLQVVSARQALLLINGKKMLAKTFVPVKPGQEIQLRATQTGSQPILRLLDENAARLPDAFQGLLKSWGRAGPFGRLAGILSRGDLTGMAEDRPSELPPLGKLKQLVTAIALKSGEASPRLLDDLIQGSGLMWEKKLLSALSSPGGLAGRDAAGLVEKDVKALAMRLLQASAGAGLLAADVDNMQSFLEGLENLQLLNKYADEESGRYLFPLPVFAEGELKFGQMLLALGEGRKKSDKEDAAMVKVSFLLTLTRLGDLRADFSVLGQSVSGGFGVASEEVRDFMLPHLPELTRKLRDNGFDVRDISCQVLGAEALAETALFDQAIAGAHNGVLNLVI